MQQYTARMSVHWRAQCHAKRPTASRISAPEHPAGQCGNRTHFAELTVTRLNHKAIGSYRSMGKTDIWLVISRSLEPSFCMQDWHSRISQVQYQRQTRYTRILDSKPVVHTCFFLCTVFQVAQCSTSCLLTSESEWELRTWNLVEIEIKLWIVA